MSATMLEHALGLASHGYEVFPLAGKVPAVPGGRGCLDATTDVDVITRLWTARPQANIGLRIPLGHLVIDIDPRHDGDLNLQLLEALNEPLPATRTAESGRGDGGRHFHFLAPGGPVTSAKMPQGIDLKTRGGYVVAPPSLHPDGGQPYRWLDLREPVQLPQWLAEMLVRVVKTTTYTASPVDLLGLRSGSIADEYSQRTTWADVLRPHGWTLVAGDGDRDGSAWRHPTATSSWSATVRHGCLFVYSPNTPLDTTEAGGPRGYTRFRAYAVLNHNGDLSAAATFLRVGAR